LGRAEDRIKGSRAAGSIYSMTQHDLDFESMDGASTATFYSTYEILSMVGNEHLRSVTAA